MMIFEKINSERGKLLCRKMPIKSKPARGRLLSAKDDNKNIYLEMELSEKRGQILFKLIIPQLRKNR